MKSIFIQMPYAHREAYFIFQFRACHWPEQMTMALVIAYKSVKTYHSSVTEVT